MRLFHYLENNSHKMIELLSLNLKQQVTKTENKFLILLPIHLHLSFTLFSGTKIIYTSFYSRTHLALRSNLPVFGSRLKTNGKRFETTIKLAFVTGSEFVITISVSTIAALLQLVVYSKKFKIGL